MNARRTFNYKKDASTPFEDGRLDAPAFHRNKDAILEVLKANISTERPQILEIASGTGQHAAYIAEHWPQAGWWPSDLQPEHIVSIDAWRHHAQLDNVSPAQIVDVTSTGWTNGDPWFDWPAHFDGILSANMIHIAPWVVTEALIEGASRRLSPHGALFIYGPFKRDGQHTAPSNAAFDQSLRSRDPSWGVRDVSQIQQVAREHGLALAGIADMPANNQTLILKSV